MSGTTSSPALLHFHHDQVKIEKGALLCQLALRVGTPLYFRVFVAKMERGRGEVVFSRL
jgi:hypothetical protein